MAAAATFHFKAVDGAGLPQEGELQGISHSAVMEELKNRGLQVMRLDEKKSGMKMDVKVGMDLGVDAAMNIHLKAGVNLVIEAGVMITLKAGASSIVIGPAGISIVGAPMVMINSGGSAGSGGGANPKPVLAVKAPVNQKDPIA